MENVEDPDFAYFQTAQAQSCLPRARARWTYRSSESFVTDSVPAFAFVGPLGESEDLPPHAHDFIEIVVVGEGRGLHVSSQGVVVMKPGTVVIVRPGAWHAFRRAHDVTVAMIGIAASALNTDLAFLRARPSTRDLLYAGPLGGAARGVWITEMPPAAASDVLEESRSLVRGLETRPFDTLRILGKLIAVLGAITGGMTAPEIRMPTHPAVTLVINRLEAALERRWSVAELAEAANLDEAYLTRLFTANVGVPPIAYLARLRIEKSTELLTSTTLSVSHIGALVGWPDPAYFSRRFHALIGLSPREYRRHMATDNSGRDPRRRLVEIGWGSAVR